MPKLNAIVPRKSSMNQLTIKQTLSNTKHSFVKHSPSWAFATTARNADLHMADTSQYNFLSIRNYGRENATDTGGRGFAIMELGANLGIIKNNPWTN